MTMKEVEIQRQYYSNTAHLYDDMHLVKDQQHVLGMHLLAAYIEYYQIRSVLDIGAGTGRTLVWLKQRYPNLIVKGIEPVKALREAGFKKGVSPDDLLDGNVSNLSFADNSFDLVCEFAVLHHVREPDQAIREMSRVASKMLCISDCNFMGQGTMSLRILKYKIFMFGLWRVANWIKTRGKGYTVSQEDGLAYSYSVYQSFPVIRQYWEQVRITTTEGLSDSLFSQILSASQLLLIAQNKKHNLNLIS